MYSRVGDVELAKDLVASTMEKAYAKGHEVRNPAAYGAWLFMIAKNVMFSHFRSTKLENTRYELAQNELRFVDRPSNPETSLLFRERLDELKRQRSKLSTRDQDRLRARKIATRTLSGDMFMIIPISVPLSSASYWRESLEDRHGTGDGVGGAIGR